MRLTVDIPKDLVNEAMAITQISKKQDLFTTALQNLIKQEKVKGLKEYFGKIDIDIDLDALRKR